MNRRSEPRFDVYYRAKIVAVDTPDQAIDALLTDISAGGMRLVAMQDLAEDLMICVEIGQHLVLAEVRSSTPRGSRFQIGAEKIHTLNLLSLPDSIGPEDRIQALVDDYHLRIQFALENERANGEPAFPTTRGGRRKTLEEPRTDIKRPEQAAPSPGGNAPPAQPVPAVASPSPLPQQIPQPVAESPVAAGPTAADAAGGDPDIASAIPTDLTPVVMATAPVKAVAEVEFGNLQVALPDVTLPGAGPLEGDAISPAGPGKLEEPAKSLMAPEASPEAAAPNEPGPLPPVQPIWMSPPDIGKAGGERHTEADPLRAIAIQSERETKVEPEPGPDRRKMAIAVGAAVAAIVLIALLFGPIRNRASLSPPAAASEKSPTQAANPKELVIDVGPAGSNPAAPNPEQPSSAPPPVAPIPAATPAAPAPPAAVSQPKPVAAPVKTSQATGERVHSSSIQTSGSSWIWACADGKTLQGRMISAGSTMEIEFSRQAEVLIGNAGAVRMDLDGKPLGEIGPQGQARVVKLTPEGFRVATAVASQECGNPF